VITIAALKREFTTREIAAEETVNELVNEPPRKLANGTANENADLRAIDWM
jgi:hypothetical protein